MKSYYKSLCKEINLTNNPKLQKYLRLLANVIDHELINASE